MKEGEISPSSADRAPPPILIGAGGAVGSRIVRAWHAKGSRPVVVGRAASADLNWDLTGTPPPCPTARGAGVVVLAGVTPLSNAPLSDNTRIAKAGIEAARFWGAAHIFIVSTSAVYGATPCAPVDEDTVPKPTSTYGEAKLAMERACAASDVTALRLTNVAGASQPFLNIARGGSTPPLDFFEDAPRAPMRSFIGPVALAECLAALCAAASDGVDLPETLNVAARHPVSMVDIFTARGLKPIRPAAPAGAVRFVNLDTARLSRFWSVPEQDAEALWDEVYATDGTDP